MGVHEPLPFFNIFILVSDFDRSSFCIYCPGLARISGLFHKKQVLCRCVGAPPRGGGSQTSSSKLVYKYIVEGGEYFCRCGSSLLSLSGATFLFGKKNSRGLRFGRRSVVYYDPKIPSSSCHNKDVKASVIAFLSAMSAFSRC